MIENSSSFLCISMHTNIFGHNKNNINNDGGDDDVGDDSDIDSGRIYQTL